MGVHHLATNGVYMYAYDESMAWRELQEIGSCLLHSIKNIVHTETLIMYVLYDQCGRQNHKQIIKNDNFVVGSNDYSLSKKHIFKNLGVSSSSVSIFRINHYVMSS